MKYLKINLILEHMTMECNNVLQIKLCIAKTDIQDFLK